MENLSSPEESSATCPVQSIFGKILAHLGFTKAGVACADDNAENTVSVESPDISVQNRRIPQIRPMLTDRRGVGGREQTDLSPDIQTNARKEFSPALGRDHVRFYRGRIVKGE